MKKIISVLALVGLVIGLLADGIAIVSFIAKFI